MSELLITNHLSICRQPPSRLDIIGLLHAYIYLPIDKVCISKLQSPLFHFTQTEESRH